MWDHAWAARWTRDLLCVGMQYRNAYKAGDFIKCYKAVINSFEDATLLLIHDY